MSRFSNLFGGAIGAAHASIFSRPVQIRWTGQAALSTPAVVHNARQSFRRDAAGGSKSVLMRRCRFTEFSSVRHDAIVTIDGDDWQIDEILTTDTPGTEVELMRTLRHEAGRSNYRR